MCGRIMLPARETLLSSSLVRQVSQNFPAALAAQAIPGQAVPILNETGTLGMMRWGFFEGKIYNARKESIDRLAFWRPHRGNHVIMPIAKFYEGRQWFAPDADYLYGAALCTPIKSNMFEVTLITEPANERVRPYHKRQPLFLNDSEAYSWLETSELLRS